MSKQVSFLSLCALVVLSATVRADQYGLNPGQLELQSANVIAFGPDGILFVGDAKAAQIVAIQTGDRPGDPAEVKHSIDNVDGKIAQQLGLSSVDILDMTTNPLSGHLFVAVSTGAGPQLVMLDGSGAIVPLGLDNITHAKMDIPNAPEDKVVGEGRRARNHRLSSVTDLAFVDGQLLVSGMSNTAVPSTVRSFAFPFADRVEATGLEIYHGAHGQLESLSPIRTFVPFMINGEATVLAGFVCTPLVKFPVSAISGGDKVRGTTIAELGNHNQPLDMITYRQGDKDYLLLANSARGVMKISTDDIDRAQGIEERIGDTAGQEFETVAGWTGVVQLDRLNDKHAVVLLKSDKSGLSLKTMPLP